MIRVYCDVCDQEIADRGNTVAHRIKRDSFLDNQRVMVEVIVGIGGTWNKGHLCRDCLIRFLEERV